jgi:uncharacterized membrane protein
MSNIHAGETAFTRSVSRSFPDANRIRRVQLDQPRQWLAAGWRDLIAAPMVSLSLGLVFVIAGLALTLGLWRADQAYMIVPLTSGFLILGPALTLGFQAVSRDLEAHRRPSAWGALTAWKTNPGPIFNTGLALMFLFLVWLRLAQLAFALAFPATIGFDPQSLLSAAFLTYGGLIFLALFMALGAAMAILAFAAGAFALPMLFDRDVGTLEAITTSYAAVKMNLRVMALWAALLVALVGAGLAFFYIGLAVTLPLAGHATWHAYRAVIRT